MTPRLLYLTLEAAMLPCQQAIEKFLPQWGGLLREVFGLRWEDPTRGLFKEEFSALRAAFEDLSREIKALAEVQRRTEQRVDRLEKTFQELAEVQRRTELEVAKLSQVPRQTRQMVRGAARCRGLWIGGPRHKGPTLPSEGALRDNP